MAFDPNIFLDPYLIWFFRLTNQAWLNFLLGTLAVALLTILVGDLTSYLASSLVRRRYTEVAAEARRYQNLSMEALEAGDRPAYDAANKLANDAFNKSFYMQLALSATFFWPVFFALGWMQYRFFELDFPIPFIGLTLGYIGMFILAYIPAYVLFKKIKRRLPFFGPVQAATDNYQPGLPPSGADQAAGGARAGES
jgi:hypothetical protein